MKRFCIICMAAIGVLICGDSFAAKVLTPKKAAPVAKKETTTSTTGMGASLLPTAIGLVSNVMQLSQQHKALIAECEPTSAELTFVNNLVKEWANAGGTKKLGRELCTGNESYKASIDSIEAADSAQGLNICWNAYTLKEARGAVWAGYPKVEVITYCPHNEYPCTSKDEKKTTNMWDIFSAISFTDADYTKSEATQAAALRQKVDKCSESKIAARRMESLGGFVTGTISNLGQTTNTGNIMETVGGLVGQSGVGGLGSLAGVAAQFLDR